MLNVKIYTTDDNVYELFNVTRIIDHRTLNQIEFICKNLSDSCGISYDIVGAIVYDIVKDSSCSEVKNFEEVTSDPEYDF